MIVLVGNHSQTTSAIEMDSEFRGAFYQLFLVGAAVHRINQPNAPALKQHESEWIKSAAYPVLVCFNGRYQASQHPTHYTYKEYQDTGNPPIGLVSMCLNTVKIGNQTYFLSGENAAFTPNQIQMLNERANLVNLNSGAGLSRVIEEVFGVKPSKSPEYAALKERVKQHYGTIS